MGRGTVVIICQLYFLALSITFLSLSSLAYNKFQSPLAEYELLLENWSLQPITDIRVSFNNCTSQEEILNSYTWPGTWNGCDCIGSTNNYIGRILNGSTCNSSLISHGCQSIYGLKPIQFELSPIVNQSVQVFQLCATREINNNFYNNSPVFDCPPNTLKCGTNQDYFYCTQALKCPIFNIGFANNSASIPDGAEVIQMSNTLFFWKSRANDTDLPLVEFRIDEGPGVCILNHALGITPGRKDYPLMNVSKQNCQRDPRFTQLYSIDEVSFYSQNNQLGIPNTQFHYNISSNYTWGLYARNYVHWKQICRSWTFDDFKAQDQNLKNIKNLLTDIVFISAFYVLIIGIGYPILWCIYEGKCLTEMSIVEVMLQIGFQIVDAVFVINTFAKIINEMSYLSNLLSQNCSDQVTQLTLQNLHDTIESDVYTIHLVRTVFFFINWFIEFCVIMYFFIKWGMVKVSEFNFASPVYLQPPQIELQQNEQKLDFQQNQVQEPHYPNPNFDPDRIEYNEKDEKPRSYQEPIEKQL